MPFIETGIAGLILIEPRVFTDSRGYFMETYNEQTYEQAGISTRFVQDNESSSQYGVVRGLHYQLAPYAQSKLVRVIEGSVLDVAVDIRKGSPTFGKHYSVVLSGENKKQLFIPRGFAHGFAVLSKTALFSYKCDNFYHKEAEGGIIFNDSTLNIDWQLPTDKMIVSDKDIALPSFENCKNNFQFQ